MGKSWDHGVPSAETWAAIAEHLLPGAHLMAFGGDRTFHRLACAIEDAGLEVRRHWAWCHLQGFPKSLDVSKAIDKAAGAVREVVGRVDRAPCKGGGENTHHAGGDMPGVQDLTVPATPQAQTWDGYGTDTKPALEFITLARKPFRGTVAANCLAHGTGALAIDAARIPTSRKVTYQQNDLGRWPANLLLDDAGAAMLDRQSGDVGGGFGVRGSDAGNTMYGNGSGLKRSTSGQVVGYGDQPSGASRMFHRVETALDAADPLVYQPKAATSEREAGLNHRKRATVNDGRKAVNGAGNDNPRLRGATARACQHPTVKPIDLATKLATLLLPPAEYAPRRILVPFSGVCSEVIGCLLAGWDEVVGIELDPEHVSIGADRVRYYGNRVQLALPGCEVAS